MEQNFTLMRKRSTLKRKSTLKGVDNIECHSNLNNENIIKRKITWNIDESEQNNDGDSALNKSSDRSYSSAKTHYSDLEEKDDLYLQKLHEINSIEPTKEIIEEIVELTENYEIASPEKGIIKKLIDDTENLDLNKGIEGSSNSNENQSPNLTFKRKRSIKDELDLIKSVVQKNEDELSTEVIAETMKNTLYNRVIGKIGEEYEN